MCPCSLFLWFVTYSVTALIAMTVANEYEFAFFFFFGISAVNWMLPQEEVGFLFDFFAGDVEPEAQLR